MRRELDLALKYAAWALHTHGRAQRHHDGVLFKQPAKVDPKHLLCTARSTSTTASRATASSPTTSAAATASSSPIPGTDLAGALDQANYCIWCHEQGKDSCSKGLREKTPADGGHGRVQEERFGVTLAGCPLEEKISEFHIGEDARAARSAALAIIVVDNPMAARDRPPHLQRLHEGVHLPEAGAGGHSAGRDADAEGRARAAVGIRDLFAAHALESAQPAPPAAAPAQRASVLVVGMGPAGFTPGAPPDERRPHRRRRSTGSRSSRCEPAVGRRRRRRRACRSRRSATSASCTSRSTSA